MSGGLFNLLTCELDAYDGPEGHRFRGYSFGREAGASLTGFSVYELEPGEATWAYHFELTEEEWLIVVAGEVTLRDPDGERVLRAGDTVCFPAGTAGAHAVRNAGDSTARLAMPSSAARHGSATVYPDTGTYRISGPGFRHRARLGEPVEFWEGET
jgi:uncharacterized cupin superfamily protein